MQLKENIYVLFVFPFAIGHAVMWETFSLKEILILI